MDFLVISYHADSHGSNYYRKCAGKLVSGLRRLGLEHTVEEISSRGCYTSNCRFKPTFIREHLRRRQGPVLWLDVDSEIHRDPVDFRKLDSDVDMALASPNGQLTRAKASPILFNYTNGSFHFLGQWIARIQDHESQDLGTFDHEPMLEVVAELSDAVNFRLFGDLYCARARAKSGQPIITMGIARGPSKREALMRLTYQTPSAPARRDDTPRVLGAGFPFEVDASSCWMRKPQFFTWTDCGSDDHLGVRVDMDGAILRGVSDDSGQRKAAWLVESSSIRQDVFDFAIAHPDRIQQNYEVFFTCDRRLADQLDNSVLIATGSNLSWAKPIHPDSVQKRKTCSMFCSRKQSTSGHRFRHGIARKYKDRIDLFGGALGSTRIGVGAGMFPDKSDGLNDYMFHIVVENASYDYYFTEKLTDCFVTCTVPVYWGCPSIHEYFNTDGMIPLDDHFDPGALTEELYRSKWEAIVDNYHRACALLSADDELFLHLSGAF